MQTSFLEFYCQLYKEKIFYIYSAAYDILFQSIWFIMSDKPDQGAKAKPRAEQEDSSATVSNSRLEEDLRHEKSQAVTTLLSTLGGSWRLASSPGLPLRTPPRRSKS